MPEFITIPVKSEMHFVADSLKITDYSEEFGISTKIGKLRSNQEKTIIQAYLFDPNRWEHESARTWVSENHRSNENKIERRFVTAEMRLSFDSKIPKIIGYAAKFNVETELWPGFREMIAPGTFTDTIKEDDVRALINHDPNFLLGRNRANTLRLWEDKEGLGYEILPPDTQASRDLQVSIKRGDISQSSFGFQIIKEDMEIDKESDDMTRTIQKVKLFDVSPVTYPAYPQTEVSMRMTKNDDECFYFLGDEVITVPSSQKRAKAEDEELFSRIDELRKAHNP